MSFSDQCSTPHLMKRAELVHLDTTTGTPDLSGSGPCDISLCRINPAFRLAGPSLWVVVSRCTRAERQNRSWLLVVGLISSAFLFGCAVGPNYKPPQTSVGASFVNNPTNAASADETALAAWWRGFNDTRLDTLVDRAMTNNHDLRIATANLKEARALRRLAAFDLAPTVQANAGYANSLLSKAAALPGTPRSAREGELYDASFDATWELDLFGRVRRSVQAANAQLGSVEATRLDVLVSVTAEVARNDVELRGAQNQLAVARTLAPPNGRSRPRRRASGWRRQTCSHGSPSLEASGCKRKPSPAWARAARTHGTSARASPGLRLIWAVFTRALKRPTPARKLHWLFTSARF